MELEICCGDISSVKAAVDGGANRIELCSALSEGGVTPSAAMIKAAIESGIEKINVLIRPRGGDFIYSKEELQLVADDIDIAIDLGATGIVIGALTPDGDIDLEAMKYWVEKINRKSGQTGKKINMTFHRAFDVARNPEKAFQDIKSLGFDCLLTSGQGHTAEEGITLLRKLVELSDGKITVMAGKGVNPDNVAKIIRETGVNAVHSSASDFINGHQSSSPEIVKSLISSIE